MYHSIQTEMTTFAAALTSICEGHVSVVVDGQACTDGRTIHLPRPHDFASDQVVDSEQFLKSLQGIACHEAAHLYYQSPPRFQQFVVGYPEKDRPLAAACINAVFDVSDESRFERRFGLARDYFSATMSACVRKRILPGRCKLPRQSWEDVLVAAIFAVRVRRITDPYSVRAVIRAQRSSRLITHCVRILREAVCRSGKGSPRRTEARWAKLSDVAAELFRKLSHSKKYDPCSSASAQLTSRSDPTQASAASLQDEGGGGVMGEIHRELIAEGTAGGVDVDVRDPRAGRHKAFKVRAFAPGGYGHQVRFLTSVAADGRIRRYARDLLSAPDVLVAQPSCVGPLLGDLTRWRIDGRSLLRKTERQSRRIAVAVVLDCSQSMEHVLPEVAAIAGGMAKALAEGGGNVACWHFGCTVHRRWHDDMRRVSILGGTATHLALRAARTWLLEQPESRRVCFLLTDGQPNDSVACSAEAQLAARQHTHLLVGTLNDLGQQRVRDAMPNASIFAIDRLEAGFNRAIQRIVMSPE